MKNKIKIIQIRLVHFFRGHKLVGHNLVNIDPNTYPYCDVCGAKPKENHNFFWFCPLHTDIRNRLLGLGKYQK